VTRMATLKISSKTAARALNLLLIAGIALLFASFFAKSASDRLLKQHPRHAQSLLVIDVLDGVVVELEAARKALTNYYDRTPQHRFPHWASPRESARHLERARKRLKKCRDLSGAVTEIDRQLEVLIPKLSQADTVRGELYYSPFTDVMLELEKTCESERSSLVGNLPKGLMVKMAKLRRRHRITLTVGTLVVGISLLGRWALVKAMKRATATWSFPA
jgi:hypothetical protein